MKRIKKKANALGVSLAVLASSIVPVSAPAWEAVNWLGTYTPSTGTFFANSGIVRITNLCWTDTDIGNAYGILKRGIEFEFRPKIDERQRPDGFHDIWKSNTSNTTNLPDAYFEFQPPEKDTDDVAICCGNIEFLVSGITYYGYMNLQKQPYFTPCKLPYTFESELGEYIPVASWIRDDYNPLKSATYLNGTDNVFFETEYNWRR